MSKFEAFLLAGFRTVLQEQFNCLIFHLSTQGELTRTFAPRTNISGGHPDAALFLIFLRNEGRLVVKKMRDLIQCRDWGSTTVQGGT